MIRPGAEWGSPTSATADLEVVGSDADLAEAVSNRPGVLVRFRPDASSDFAGAVGLGVDTTADLGIEVALDLLRLGDGRTATNMLVVGIPPDSSRRIVRRIVATVHVDGRPAFEGLCTAIVIATGQFRRGLDLVPRGHPGDGRAEVQVYAVAARERRELRARLATGTHVPHPNITQRAGSHVEIRLDHRAPFEIDGHPAPETDLVDIEVVPSAYRLLL